MQSVDCAGRVEVIRGDDLETRGGDQRRIDEDDGAGRADGVGHLGSGVGRDRGAGGDGSGRQHGKAVGTDWDIEVASICSEGDAGDEWGDGVELLPGGDEIDVDGTGARGLVDETKRSLAGGRGLALINQG